METPSNTIKQGALLNLEIPGNSVDAKYTNPQIPDIKNSRGYTETKVTDTNKGKETLGPDTKLIELEDVTAEFRMNHINKEEHNQNKLRREFPLKSLLLRDGERSDHQRHRDRHEPGGNPREWLAPPILGRHYHAHLGTQTKDAAELDVASGYGESKDPNEVPSSKEKYTDPTIQGTVTPKGMPRTRNRSGALHSIGEHDGHLRGKGIQRDNDGRRGRECRPANLPESNTPLEISATIDTEISKSQSQGGKTSKNSDPNSRDIKLIHISTGDKRSETLKPKLQHSRGNLETSGDIDDKTQDCNVPPGTEINDNKRNTKSQMCRNTDGQEGTRNYVQQTGQIH